MPKSFSRLIFLPERGTRGFNKHRTNIHDHRLSRNNRTTGTGIYLYVTRAYKTVLKEPALILRHSWLRCQTSDTEYKNKDFPQERNYFAKSKTMCFLHHYISWRIRTKRFTLERRKWSTTTPAILTWPRTSLGFSYDDAGAVQPIRQRSVEGGFSRPLGLPIVS